MKILVICHYGLYKNISNSFVHKQVREYVRLGHSVDVIIPIAIGKADYRSRRFFPMYKTREVEGVRLHYLRYISFSSYGERGLNLFFAKLCLWNRVRMMIKNDLPDIIHAHTIEFDGALANWINKKNDIPVIITTHGSDTCIPLQQNGGKRLKKVCDSASEIVAVSKNLARKLGECGTKTKISTVYNGFSEEYIRREIERKPFSVIQVGNLTKQKNYATTIQAFALAARKHAQATLTIIGEGPERCVLEKMCLELGIRDRVFFLGKVDNKRVFEEMSKHQVFIMPSTNEGFGIVYLEAMASGCVTIGTAEEAITEILTDGRNGFVVNPYDVEEIADLFEKIWLYNGTIKEMADQGRKSASEFTWRANAQEYIRKFELLNIDSKEKPDDKKNIFHCKLD